MMPAMGLGTGGYGGPGGGGEWWNDTMVTPIVTEFLKRGGRRIDTAYVLICTHVFTASLHATTTSFRCRLFSLPWPAMGSPGLL
jgi:hypothetical protein